MPQRAHPTNPLDAIGAWEASEFLERYSAGQRAFPGINLLRPELAAMTRVGARLDLWVNADSSHNPLWDDYKLGGLAQFEYDSYGRLLVPGDAPPARDLSSRELIGIDLAGSYLYPVDFSQSNLSNSNLQRAIFIDCDLSSAMFRRADLRRARFESCRLDHADFYMARMDRVVIYGCSARSANFSRAKLAKAHIGGDLRESQWNNAHCRATWLTGDLRGVDLSHFAPLSTSVSSATILSNQVEPLLRLLGIELV